ncbi:MAG: FtsX-like permease family protein, partial [bacterium]|nr:FtsX-like permease family protein [bacterium]
MLARNSGFTLAAVLSLALGIGANTTIFSVANGLLLRPLPVSEPDRLVKIWTSFEHGSRATVSSYPDYADLRDGPSGFSDVAAYFYFPVSVSAAGQPEVVAGGLVSPNYFEVLGVEPVRGRGFRSGEDDELPAAVVSHSLWRRSLRDDPDTIGRKILINGHPFTVIGVAPEGFTSTTTGMAPDVWFPVRLADVALPLELDIDDRAVRWLRMVGRLQPETSLAQAQAAADVAAKRLKAEHPDTNGDATFTLMDASEGRFFTVEMGKLAASGAGLLMALVGLVLLIACSNVTCLYLMRAVTREREMAMRAVLGGGRWRITRQLLVESLLVSGLAGGAGILLAVWLLELVRIPDFGPIPIHVDVGLDWSVCAFTAVVSLATGLLLGIVPALRSGGLDLTSALKHGRSGSGARPSRARLQSALVSLQVERAELNDFLGKSNREGTMDKPHKCRPRIRFGERS